jgi:hypothetical protein
LTYSNERQNRINIDGLGANIHGRRPIDFVQFRDAARQSGPYWSVLNQPRPDKKSQMSIPGCVLMVEDSENDKALLVRELRRAAATK